MNEINQITEQVINSCINIHRNLGPGLLESTYQQCLAFELKKKNINFEKEKSLPIQYEDISVSDAYRVDFLIEDKVIVELKSIEQFHPVHEAQILTYLKLSKIPVGLLINFKVRLLKDGIRRYAN